MQYLKVISAYLLITLVVLLGLDRLFSEQIFAYNKTTNYYKLQRLVEQNNPDEIPLFGSSTVLRGLLPEVLGENFHNYGITATNFQKMEPMLLVELSKNKDTPIIIEMPPPFFEERPRPNIRMEDFLPVADRREFRNFLKTYDFTRPWHVIPGMRYFGYYSTYFGSFVNRELPKGMYFSRGAKYVKRKLSPEGWDVLKEKRMKEPVKFSASQSLINRFMQMASQTKRDLILLVSPYHSIVYEAGFDLEHYKELFSKLEREFPNVKGIIVDGSQYGDDLFLDTSHLNYWGAEKFSNTLRESLDSLGVSLNKRQ